MGQQAPTLKWGDIIRIHGVNLSKKDQGSTKGLIVSKGFTDPNIYYQKYKNFQDVNLYRESLFQICPRISFDVHDQFEDASTQVKEQNKGRLITEIENFQKVLKTRAGSEVKYGAQVIFKHVQSQSYLRGILKAADIGEGAFKIDVTQSMSSKIIFKIKSHRTYEHQNDKIYYDDALLIYHPNADCFMNFTEKDEPIYLDTDFSLEQLPLGHPFQQYSMQRPLIKRPEYTRIPVINENKSKCYWKFIQHCSNEEYISKQKIKSHDIVYFQHTKNNGLVSSALSKDKNGKMINYLKESENGLYYQCFWELIPKEVNELGPEECNSFCARNIVTGQLLDYQGFKVEIVKEGQEESSSPGFDDEGLINLVCSEKDDNGVTLKLDRGQEFEIDYNVQKIVAEYEKNFSKIKFKAVTKMPKDIFKIYKVDQKTLLDVQFALSSHEPLVKLIELLTSGLMRQDQPQFWFQDLVKSEFLKEDVLNNIITILKMLIGKIYHSTYDDCLTSGTLPDNNIQKILVEAGIVQLVIQMVYLIYKPFKSFQDDQFKDRQSDQCFRIRSRLADIFQFSYRFLEKTASYNESNRTYISRWVDLFLLHSNTINRLYIQQCLVGILQNNPVSIEATINQQKIRQQIKSFFGQAKQLKTDAFLTTKYLRLFSTFIVCEDRVIRENQKIILNDFFKNIENQFSFRFKVQTKPQYQAVQEQKEDFISKLKRKQVKIAFGRQQLTTIKKFFRDWTSKWDYFIAYVNLLADICMYRNSEAIQNVSVLLSLQIVSIILFDPDLEELNREIHQENMKHFEQTGQLKFPIANIHEPFIRIAHYLYIDNDKFHPVKRIKKISRWYAHEGEEGPIYEEINKTKRIFQGQKQEEQLRYLRSILVFLKKYLEGCNQDHHNLSMLYTVLNVLKTTVTLGLWKKSEQFRQIIPLLMMRITKIEKEKFFEATPQTKNRLTPEQIVKTNKSLLKLNRPEITKSIDCKIKATQIFQQMNQFQMDIRLRYLMNFFKGLYETTQDFNVYDFMEDQDKNKQQQLSEEEQKIHDRNTIAQEEYHSVKEQNLLGENVKKVSQDQEIILKQNVWYNKLKEMTPFTFDKKASKDPIKNRYQFQGGLLNEISKINDHQKIVQIADKHFRDLVMSFMELSVYHNERLLNSSLKTLRIIFQQRKHLIVNFKSILICGKGNLEQVYLTLKFMRGKFGTLSDQNILKYEGQCDPLFSYALWKPYDYLQKVQEKRSGIIQDLWFLSKTLIENISLKNIESLMTVDEQAFVSNRVYSYIDERQKTNTLFQSVNLAQGIYKPLIQYIKIVGDADKLPPFHHKLLCSIYQYLSLLCFNNLQAKQLLMNQIPYILTHLNKKVGAAHFLYVVSQNNKLLVSNEELVGLIVEKSLNACLRLDHDAAIGSFLGLDSQTMGYQYEKSCIFYALRGILLFHEKGHRKNQELLMDRLQDNKFRGLIIKDRTIDYKAKLLDFNLSPQQAFVTAHFQMFSSLVESGNFINIGKLQNIHSYPYLLTCIKSTSRWQIRRSLRSYINRLYYLNKDKDIFLFEEFIRKQFDIINEELFDLVQLHKSKLLTIDLRIKNGIRFKYGVSEIMLFIIEILITLHEIFLKSEFMKVLRRQLNKEEKYADSNRILHQKIIKLYKYLGCLNKLYPETKTLSSFLREVSTLVKKVLLNFQVKYLQKKSEPESEMQKPETDEIGGQVEKKSYIYDHSKSFFRNLNDMIRDLKAKEKLETLIQQFEKKKESGQSSEADIKNCCLNTIYSVPSEKLKAVYTKSRRNLQTYHNPHLQTTTSRTFKVLAKPQISDNEQNLRLNERLGTVKVMVDELPIFNKFRDDQFIKLVSIISSLDDTSALYYEDSWNQYSESKKPVISLKQCFSTIFKMIIQSPSSVPDTEKIFVIKMVRCYITESIESKQEYKLPVDKWSPDYHDGTGDQDIKFKQHQQLLMECGCSQFIISIMSEDISNRLELLNEVLLLGIAYLFGGNEACQNSLLDALQEDKQNLMLLSLRKIINKIGDFLIEIRAIQESDKERNYAINIVDTYDFFSVKDHSIMKQFGVAKQDKFQYLTQIANEDAMCRLFRFLQLFCQNNNTAFKKFLETQTNKDKSKKTNSVNFIDEACLLLRKFFKIMNIKVVNIPNNLLAFIGEITQLPCLDNQISLLKSTFYEDISYLATFFDEEKHRTQRKFNASPDKEDDPLYSLMDIYEQGVVLANSNFQGNNPVIFSQFLNKCHPKYLWLVIRQNIWQLFQEERYQDWEIISTNQNYHAALLQTLANLDEEHINKIIDLQVEYNREFQGHIIGILNVISILKKLDDYALLKQNQGNQDKQNPDLQALEEFQKVLKFRKQLIDIGSEEFKDLSIFITKFQDLLLQIEVSSFNGKEVTLQNIYFPKHPVFKYLSPTTKDDIMMVVERTTRRDKLLSLTKFYDTIVSEIQWGYQLNKNVFNLGVMGEKKMPITSDLSQEIRKYARNCSFLIVFLLILFITVDHEKNDDEMNSSWVFSDIFSKIIIKLLCFLQLGLSLFYCYLWGKMRARLCLIKYHSQEEEQTNSGEIQYEEAKEEIPKIGWITLTYYISVLWNKFLNLLGNLKSLMQNNSIYNNLIQPIVAISHAQAGFLSLVLFISTSFIGTFYRVEYFTIHLFDIFTTIPLLSNVFKAVITNIKPLATLSMLATAFVLVFNVLSLSTYTPVIFGQDIPEQSCEDILDCVLVVYTSEAIGGDMEELVVGRFIFDTIFVVFMEMLFANLISTVMLDAFGKLKDEDDERDADKSEVCYICSIKKTDVEKTGGTLPKHIQNHFLWNYIFYIYCLKNKDATDYTGIQYTIITQLPKEQVDWFPDLGENEDEGQLESTLDSLKQKVESVRDRTKMIYQHSNAALQTVTKSKISVQE